MDADFLVIGGGIAGISAAARLSSMGSVIVLEAEAQLAHHASGRSAALYEPHYGAKAVVELSMASGAYFHGAAGVLSPRGLMILGRPGEEEAFDHDLAAMAFERVSVAEARAVVPILNGSVTMAGMADHAWDIDTDLLLQGFARDVRAAGGKTMTKARVTAITRTAMGWQVATTAGVFSGRLLVNAAGAWVDEVAVMAGVQPLGFQPMRRSMARIPAPGGFDVSGWPMIFSAGEAWYAKPDAGALIVSPAEEHPMPPQDAWADDMVLAEGLARYEEYVTEPVTRVISNWAGLRTFSPDRVPVIGPDAREPAFFWVAGQGGYGFQSAPAASRLMADIAGGAQTALSQALVAALSPARFG